MPVQYHDINNDTDNDINNDANIGSENAFASQQSASAPAAKTSKKTRDQPHDSLFKELMENHAVARDFLIAWLPEQLSQLCDFASIEAKPTSFVARRRTAVCDTLFGIKAKYSAEHLYVFGEHQSTLDKHMRLRMKHYKASIEERYCDDDGNAPLVVPILLYHGERSPYPSLLSMQQKNGGAFAEYTDQVRSDFVPVLADLTVVPDEVLMSHGLAAFLEITLKHTCRQSRRITREQAIARSGQFLSGMQLLKNRHGEENLALYHRCLEHWFKNNKIPPDISISEIVQSLPEHLRGDIMLHLDTLEQRSWHSGIMAGRTEGKTEGIQIGEQIGRQESQQEIARRMLQLGWKYADITAVTGLREDELKKPNS